MQLAFVKEANLIQFYLLAKESCMRLSYKWRRIIHCLGCNARKVRNLLRIRFDSSLVGRKIKPLIENMYGHFFRSPDFSKLVFDLSIK